MLGLCCWSWALSNSGERGILFTVVQGLLLLKAQSRPSVVEAHGLYSASSIVVMHRFSSFAICRILLDQGWNPCPLHCPVDSLPLSQQGSPGVSFLKSWLCKSSASSGLVCSENCSTWRYTCDMFVWEGELYIFLFCQIDVHFSIFLITVFSLSDVSFANSFSQSLACLLIIFISFYAEQKILFSVSPTDQLFLSWIMSLVLYHKRSSKYSPILSSRSCVVFAFCI